MKHDKKLFDSSLLSMTDASGRLSLFGLALPMFFELVFNSLLGTINTVVLTRVSENAVTAVNIATTVLNIPLQLISMVPSGMLIILTLFLGAGRRSEGGKIFKTGFLSALLLTALLSATAAVLAEPLLSLMNIEGEILAQAVLYFRIRCGFLLTTAVTTCCTATLRAYGHSRPTMIAGMVANAVNLAVSLVVISPYYTGDEIVGVAAAAGVGQLAGAMYTFTALYRKDGVSHSGELSLRLLRRILAVGIPSGMSLLAYTAGVTFSTSIISSLGQQAVNTKVYTANISLYTQMLGYALAQASALMIGRCAGAADHGKAKRLFAQAARFIPLINALLATIVLLLADPLMSMFTDSDDIKAAARIIFLIDIAIEAARGNTHVGEKALCSVADTAFTSAVSITACLVINSLGCWFFCVKLGLGIYGYFAASLIDETVRGILYRIRWHRGSWIMLSGREVATSGK